MRRPPPYRRPLQTFPACRISCAQEATGNGKGTAKQVGRVGLPQGRSAMAASRIGRSVVRMLFALEIVASVVPRDAAASVFLPTLGWEDDVDLVVAPGGEFLVVPEEDATGLGRIEIVDLDPVTGAPIALRFMNGVPGFERGVDPVITKQQADNNWVVIV